MARKRSLSDLIENMFDRLLKNKHLCRFLGTCFVIPGIYSITSSSIGRFGLKGDFWVQHWEAIAVVITIMFFLGLFLLAFGFFKPKKREDEALLSFTIETKGKSGDDLYNLANSWAVSTFVSTESVIDFINSGYIEGKYVFEVTLQSKILHYVQTTITIKIFAPEITITLSDPMSRLARTSKGRRIRYKPLNDGPVYDESWTRWKKLVSSFAAAMGAGDMDWYWKGT